MFQIHPVAHLHGEFIPDVFVAHDHLAALFVVVLDGYFFADVFFRDAQFFFYGQLYGQAVGIPAGFALYAFAFHAVIATEDVFDGPGHDVVNAGFSVGGGGAFVKDKRAIFGSLFDAFFEDIVFLPKGQHLPVYGGQVQFL